MRWRNLVYDARKVAQSLDHVFDVGRRAVGLVADRPLGIARSTYSSQTNLGLVFLIRTAEPPVEPGVATQANDQDAAGQRIERTTVANAPQPQ